MLARAETESGDTAISYAKADLENLNIGPTTFDLAYSSLAFHYVENLAGLLACVHSALAPGGRLIFSVEHPIFTAPTRPGWWINPDGHTTWPVDGYLDEGPRSTDWLAKGVIKQHRTIATYAHPAWADERQRPSFLLVGCRRSETAG